MPPTDDLVPTTDQRNTIIVACVYALAILLLWNIPILKVILYPFKLLLVESSVALRYFVLFIGVMNCLYSVWDICDDLVFRKVNESDATAFAKLVGSLLSLRAGFCMYFGSPSVGLVLFKTPVSEQKSDDFLRVPTR
ncbi:hypothetical protein CBS14141_001852 [Malassezia furfur]|nr:hypothetical protein CBS14141_001852 [Malassezia furfur]